MPSNTNAKSSASNSPQKTPGSKDSPRTGPAQQGKGLSSQGNSMKSPEPSGINGQANKVSLRTNPTPHEFAAETSQHGPEFAGSAVGINKKKQKRRQKEAAKKAAARPLATGYNSTHQFTNGTSNTYHESLQDAQAGQGYGMENGYDYEGSDYDDPDQYEPEEPDSLFYGDNYQARYAPGPPHLNGHSGCADAPQEVSGNQSKKKQRSAQPIYPPTNHVPIPAPDRFQRPHPSHPPPLSQAHSTSASRSAHNVSKDRIWNTSTAEERQRIKDFWLSLGEEDRRSLVKVEKEAVLKKMKEQQKHSCSCTVCGRKRTAIEEELEVLYDAYYDELEQYANHQQVSLEDGTPVVPPPQMYPHPMARPPPSRRSEMYNKQMPHGRVLGESDDPGDEDFDDDEDEDFSEDEVEQEPMTQATDFFNFGNSLTVQDGILTVADDLLQNDGKKFIDMMEQLAERRMQREEEAQYAAQSMGHPAMQHTNGAPLDEDGYDDDEDDDEDYSQEGDEYDDEEDEMEAMSEEQRMEEGRRMFQIFAARMFEQRVLTAYREKVAAERQQKLIEELEDESRVDAQREAKKAKEAQKKKDKKRQQKQAKDEEKAKREAEKAAEEAAAKALEEMKVEEQRQKKEEQRKKRDAEKKAQDEEKQRKEAEKQRRLQEAKEQQAEQERKQREQKEREKKKREDIKKQERDDREAKEKEAREKKEHDAAQRKELEGKIKAENEAKERSKKEESTAKPTTQASFASQPVPNRPSPANTPSTATPAPTGLQPPPSTSRHTSPRLQIATPVLPKAPIPIRPRQPSFQEPGNASPKTSYPPSTSSTMSPRVSPGYQEAMASVPTRIATQQTSAPSNLPPSQYSTSGALTSTVTQPPGFSGVPSSTGIAFHAPFGPQVSPIKQQASYNPTINPHQPITGSLYRNLGPSNGMSFPTSMNGMRPPQGHGFYADSPASQIPGIMPSTFPNDVSQYGMSRNSMTSHTHSRNTSTSSNVGTQVPPIGRPLANQRPSSVTLQQQKQPANSSTTIEAIDDLTNHLGSNALLKDSDEIPLTNSIDDSRRASMVVGGPSSTRQVFGTAPGFQGHIGASRIDNSPRGFPGMNGNMWSSPQMPSNPQISFGVPPTPGHPSWSNAPGFGRFNNSGIFGSIGAPSRPGNSRPVTIRINMRQACETLTNSRGIPWHNAEDVLRDVRVLMSRDEAPQLHELLNICDTEGNSKNGGGSFERQSQGPSHHMIRFDNDASAPVTGRGAAPGEIGSPLTPAIGSQRVLSQHGGF